MHLFISNNICVVHACGEPPHFLSTVRQQWDWTFGEQCVGCGGPLNWPPGSPSLIFWIFGCGET